jgi:periplasmic divalent cation tolerance protein
MMPNITLLYCPFPSLESARMASATLLDARVVACCNLIHGAESHYRWQGALTTSTETILIAKTSPEMVGDARALLAAAHPYECPAILSFSAETTAEFAAWVDACAVQEKNTEKGD